MLNKALEKIKNEMAEYQDNSNIQAVGNMLIGHLKKDSQCDEKILDKEKTILKALAEMEKVAFERAKELQKRNANKRQLVYISDSDGFDIVLNYFGITKSLPEKSNTFDLKLEDLLK